MTLKELEMNVRDVVFKDCRLCISNMFCPHMQKLEKQFAKFRKSLEEIEKEEVCATYPKFSGKDNSQIEGYNNGIKQFRRKLLE